MAPRQPELGIKIKRARERAGLTQQQLADLIHRDRKTVDNWENGRTSPRSSIGAIEAVLGSLNGQREETYGDPAEAAIWAMTRYSEPERRQAIAELREARRRAAS